MESTIATSSVAATIGVDGRAVSSGRVFEIAVDPAWEIVPWNATDLAPVERPLPPSCAWTFPPASVTAIEVETAPDG